MAGETESYVLDVVDVVEETGDARSVVLRVPEELGQTFAYRPGQFLTVAVPSDRDGLAARCYSLSSAPFETGGHKFTVKRTAEGYASNWVCDHLQPGDTLRVLPPSGIFTPKDLDADLLLFAAGSGITPVISIAKTALHEGSGRVVLFYANRDESAIIFSTELRELQEQHPERFTVVHWLESVQGLPTREQVAAFASYFTDFTAFVCGPTPFMKAATGALKELGFPRERRHQEKFVSLGGNPFGDVAEVAEARAEIDAADDADDPGDDLGEDTHVAVDTPAVDGPVTVEVELDGEEYAFDDYAGDVPLLDYLESKGVPAPFSCREGNCSACACVVLEGEVSMKHNEVLDEDDLADGIRLACQSLPLTDKLKISYSG